MLDWLINILKWIGSIWSSLSEDNKNKIIEVIVESFGDVFKKYYQSEQKNNDGETNANP